MKGFSLFEVLIAMTLLSVGLLSILALTVKTLRLHQEAFYFVFAEARVENLFEQLRDNNTFSVPTSFALSSFDSQLSDWNQWNRRLLPQGNGKLTLTNNDVTVTLVWDSRIKRGSINQLCSRAIL